MVGSQEINWFYEEGKTKSDKVSSNVLEMCKCFLDLLMMSITYLLTVYCQFLTTRR